MIKSAARRILHPALILFFAALVSGCSKQADDLLAFASASHMIVAEVDPAELYANARCEIASGNRLTLTPALKSIAPMLGLGFIEAKGVGLGSIVVSVSNPSSWSVAFAVTDEALFKEYLRSTHDGFSESEEGGYSVYRLSRSKAIYVRDNVGCLFCTGHAPSGVAEFEAYKADAAAHPLMDWHKKALSQDNAVNIVAKISALGDISDGIIPMAQLGSAYDPDKITDGYFKLGCSLSGLELKAKGVFTDSEGNTLEGKFDKRVDASLLKYAGADQLMSILVAMPDGFNWAEAIDRLAEMPMLAEALADTDSRCTLADVLGAVDGTLMIAAGPKSMMCMQSADDWAATIALKPAAGKAERCISGLSAMLGGEESVMVGSDGCVVADINRPEATAEAFAISAADLGGFCSVAAFDLPRQNVFSSLVSFPFGLRGIYGTDGTTLTLSVTETECDGLFLENIINFISGEY